MKTVLVSLGLSNCYGGVLAYQSMGKYYMELEDYNCTHTIEISEEFFRAVEKEFK